MADRSRLHISKLEEFKEWLIKDGWSIEEPKGEWEVLRARKNNRNNPLIVYCKMNAKEHLSVMDRDSGVIGAFLRDSKKPKTNAERIRAMSDEELAEFMEPRFFDCADYCEDFEGGCAGKCKHNQGKDFLLDWLQSEAEQ